MTKESSINRQLKNKIDLGVTLILIISLGIEIYILSNSSFLNEPSQTGSQVTNLSMMGEIMEKTNTVKIQSNDSLVWNSATTRQRLFQNDSIMTSEQSRAEIALTGGLGISIEENSLIQLEKRTQQTSDHSTITIKLIKGGLQKRSSKDPGGLKSEKFKIKTKGAEIQFDSNAEFLVELPRSSQNKNENQNLAKVQVLSGSLELQTPKGHLQIHEREEALFQNDTRPLSEPKTQPIQILPDPNVSISNLTEGTEVTFKWKTTQNSDSKSESTIELSRDSSFEKTTDFRVLSKHETKVTLPYSSQNVLWYWRMKNGTFVSSSNSFWINSKPMPEVQFPPHGSHFRKGSATQVFWTELDGAEYYEIEVNGKVQAPVSHPPFTFRLSQIGDTTWRVRAKMKNGATSEWSNSNQLTTDPIGPPSPVTLFPPEVRHK